MSELKPPSDEETTDVVPASHLQAIGRAIALWSSFEFHIDRALWQMMGVEQVVGGCVTSQFNSIFPKLNAMIALCYTWGASEAVISQLKKFSGGLGSTNSKRNRIVHDARFKVDGKEIMRFQNTFNSPPVFDWIKETEEELASFSAEVSLRRQEFFVVWKELRRELKGRIGLLPQQYSRTWMDDPSLEDPPNEHG